MDDGSWTPKLEVTGVQDSQYFGMDSEIFDVKSPGLFKN